MKINHDKKLHFSDVYITPKATELSSRSEVNLDVSYITKHSKQRITGLPVLVANMDKIGVWPMANALHQYKIGVCLHKHHSVDQIMRLLAEDNFEYSFLSFGITDIDFEKLRQLSSVKLLKNRAFKICLDVANGYMYSFLDKIKITRELFPNAIIMAGNVCTPEGTENLIKAGADIAKCGISSGGKCITKDKTGIGYPQLSVASECGQAANELNALCCSDGGIRNVADICKALGAGSHFVMSGSLFFGYEENDTDWEYDGKQKKMLSYGMSSKTANEKFFGGLKEYRAAEGKEEYVFYKGNVSELAVDIRGGLASCCTYTNTKNLENLWKNCIFIESN